MGDYLKFKCKECGYEAYMTLGGGFHALKKAFMCIDCKTIMGKCINWNGTISESNKKCKYCKSENLVPWDKLCPKCKSEMEREELGFWD